MAITYRRPWLADYQLDAIFCDAEISTIEATTKSGKTQGCLAWLFEQAAIHGRRGRNYWWVAPWDGTARIAYDRLKNMLPRRLRRCNETLHSITLANGAVIWFKSGEKPDTLYGEDVFAAVIDEGSRFRSEAATAVFTTLTATGGPIRIIGNVKGRKNWFYQLARKAQAGEPGMHYAKITADDAVAAGILQEANIERARRVMSDAVFRELYYAEASDDGGNPFGLDAIRAIVAPLSGARPEVCGIDLARSVDWTVIAGLDKDGATSRLDRFQLDWEGTIVRIVAAVGDTPAATDATGVGDGIVPRLQKECHDMLPYVFSSQSKQILMEGLAVAIQHREITVPDGVAVSELEAFEFEYTRTGVRYSAPEGMHDDVVCALALAVWRRAHMPNKFVFLGSA